MAYVVKWVAAGQRKVHEGPKIYATPSDAIDFACTILKQKPERIWIEGPSALRIEEDVIKQNCQARGKGFTKRSSLPHESPKSP